MGKTNNNRLLSVIIPSYNMERYLRPCLQSVLDGNEMADRLDVIVVNDGSRDGTAAIAHEIEAAHPGVVRVIDKENGNYGSCVNAGIREARGLYVKILDADDTFDTPAFERYLRFLDELAGESAPDAVFNDFAEVDPDGKVLRRHDYALVDEPGFTLARFDYHGDRFVWMHALAYRTELLRSIGYRQTEGIFYTDQEWDMIPLAQARTFAHAPEEVYRYLVGRAGQSTDTTVRCRHFGMHFIVAKRIIRFYVEHQGDLSPGARTMLGSQIKNHFGMFFFHYLVENRTRLDESELADFDAFLSKASPELHRFAGTLGFSGRFYRCPYVRQWRERGRVSRFSLFLFDATRSAKRILSAFGWRHGK